MLSAVVPLRGRLGEDSSALLGALLLTTIGLAAFSRASVAESNRRPFFVYVDEFQSFATDFLATMLSELRKYRVGLVLAHQHTSTRTITYVEAIAPNSRTIVQGSVNSPVEVLITDPLGRRLGFDPLNGIFYEEIPDSSYFHELSAADASEDSIVSDSHLPLEFAIGDFVAGEYKFDVFGTGTGPWSINFGVSDATGFDPFQFLYTGEATEGSFQRFTQFLTPNFVIPEPRSFTHLILPLLFLVLIGRKVTTGSPAGF